MVTTDERELLQELLNSPEADKLRQQQQKKQLDRRRRLAEELAEVIEGLKASYPKMVATEERLAEQIRRAEEQLAALRRGYGAVEERQVRNRLDGRRAQLEGELVQTAPAELDAFIHDMAVGWEEVRASGLRFSQVASTIGAGATARSTSTTATSLAITGSSLTSATRSSSTSTSQPRSR